MMAKEKPPITVVGDVGGRIAIIVVCVWWGGVGVASSQHLFLSCFMPEGRNACWCRGGNVIVPLFSAVLLGSFQISVENPLYFSTLSPEISLFTWIYKYPKNPGHAEKSPEVFKKKPNQPNKQKQLAELCVLSVPCCSVRNQHAASIPMQKIPCWR